MLVVAGGAGVVGVPHDVHIGLVEFIDHQGHGVEHLIEVTRDAARVCRESNVARHVQMIRSPCRVTLTSVPATARAASPPGGPCNNQHRHPLRRPAPAPINAPLPPPAIAPNAAPPAAPMPAPMVLLLSLLLVRVGVGGLTTAKRQDPVPRQARPRPTACTDADAGFFLYAYLTFSTPWTAEGLRFVRLSLATRRGRSASARQCVRAVTPRWRFPGSGTPRPCIAGAGYRVSEFFTSTILCADAPSYLLIIKGSSNIGTIFASLCLAHRDLSATLSVAPPNDTDGLRPCTRKGWLHRTRKRRCARASLTRQRSTSSRRSRSRQAAPAPARWHCSRWRWSAHRRGVFSAGLAG